MRKHFTPSKLEFIIIQSEDIIYTSPTLDEETYPKATVGNGGDIGLPFDPFLYGKYLYSRHFEHCILCNCLCLGY